MAKEEDQAVNSLFKEIDEEIRQDNLTLLWKKYGSFFITALVLVVLGVAGYEGYKYYDLSQRQADSNRYLQASNLIEQNDLAQAQQQFAALANDSNTGYKTLAKLQEAALYARQGNAAQAAEAYITLSKDASLKPIYKELALVLGGLNALSSKDGKEIVALLAGLIDSASPWRFTAKEISAYAHAKTGDRATAAKILTELADDASAPQGLRQRAREAAAAYGG